MSNPNNSNAAEQNQPGGKSLHAKPDDVIFPAHRLTFASTGYIAKGLDPVGNVVGKGLSPIGKGVEQLSRPISSTIGGVTKPLLGPVAGHNDEKAEILGGEKTAEDFDKTKSKGEDEPVGGKDQTAENPLGL